MARSCLLCQFPSWKEPSVESSSSRQNPSKPKPCHSSVTLSSSCWLFSFIQVSRSTWRLNEIWSFAFCNSFGYFWACRMLHLAISPLQHFPLSWLSVCCFFRMAVWCVVSWFYVSSLRTLLRISKLFSDNKHTKKWLCESCTIFSFSWMLSDFIVSTWWTIPFNAIFLFSNIEFLYKCFILFLKKIGIFYCT